MKKVVQDLTSGGIDWQREKWQSGLGSKFIHQGEKNAVKYADEVIVLSKGVQDYFKETYDRETHFIPNGVNRPQIREAKLITDHFGLEKDSYILFLGRLVPEKGIRYLVEAFKNVKTDKKLVIAGGSSDTDSFMEKLKELAKGDDRILFTGFVQGAMLDELYSNAYIYTLPSDLEGMPLSLLEAMSYGNCCLVSDIPECAEVVEDKQAIHEAIADNYDGMYLGDDTVNQVVRQYGMERVGYILANTLHHKSYDGRFSHGNKEWAEQVRTPEHNADRMTFRTDWVVDSHPAILDGFVTMFREELDAQKELEQEQPFVKQFYVVENLQAVPLKIERFRFRWRSYQKDAHFLARPKT